MTGDASETAAQADSNGGEAGDVETAGETTAAEMIGGPPDTRPVGTDTMADVRISDEPEPADDEG